MHTCIICTYPCINTQVCELAMHAYTSTYVDVPTPRHAHTYTCAHTYANVQADVRNVISH